jgi:hypothetical protein
MVRQGCGPAPAGGLLPGTEETGSAIRRIIELKAAGAPLLFSAAAYKQSLRWLKTADNGGRTPVPGGDAAGVGEGCLAGRYFCLIDHNGDVYPCPRFMAAPKRGNALRDGLKEAMAMAAGHGCRGCSMPCSAELTRLFRLEPGTMWSVFFNIALKAVKN